MVSDDNECSRSPNPCHGNAQCLNIPGSFECRCPEGYRLDHSQRGCLGNLKHAIFLTCFW